MNSDMWLKYKSRKRTKSVSNHCNLPINECRRAKCHLSVLFYYQFYVKTVFFGNMIYTTFIYAFVFASCQGTELIVYKGKLIFFYPMDIQ